MKKLLPVILTFFCLQGRAQNTLYINQLGYDANMPKTALVAVGGHDDGYFSIINNTGKTVLKGSLQAAESIADWQQGKQYRRADFSALTQPGQYRLVANADTSDAFAIAPHLLAGKTLPAMLNYYHKQRANTPTELAADAHVLLYGSQNTVDLRGGWCDASGDVSKYFSHLAYANFMSPQQIPLVTWSLLHTAQQMPPGSTPQLADSLMNEGLYGADYLMRSLSAEGYFYMIVFSYFNKDPNARRVVGLLANSVTTNDYQAAFREGGGMAIAALARAARLKQHGQYTQAQYLDAAKRAFAHLLINNKKYCDDGRENIIDDYCALMAATELYTTTRAANYLAEARKRAANLNHRLSPRGYFIADERTRPYWHAADAGLPVVALCQYIGMERSAAPKAAAMATVKAHLQYLLAVAGNTANPFGYARQTVRVANVVKDSFFIPHNNETGWWWQGENARLASLATAALTGAKVAYAGNAAMRSKLQQFAVQQLNWVLGYNPYQVCFMYRFGKNNMPYMHSSFGHGSEWGGISNGITGRDGNADGSGIDYKTEAEGNEWRWTEQWLPHAAWFMQAVAAMAQQ